MNEFNSVQAGNPAADFQSSQPDCRQRILVVTDNDMPKVTGVELIQKLRAARMTLPVIMATGAPPEEVFTLYGMLPPARTLLKPYTLKELLTSVKEVLHAASDSLGEIAPAATWQVQPLADRFRLCP